MIRIDVQADLREVEKMFRGLGPGVDRAAARALNKTAITVRAQAARDIQQKRNLKIGTIKQSLKIRRARHNRLSVEIEATGKAIAIRHFGARQSGKGVTVKILRKGKRTVLRKFGNKAFISKKASMGGNVFVRTTAKRLPIVKWPGVPGIASVFEQKQIEQRMRREARKIWPKRLRQELNFEIEKVAAKARGAG